MDALPPFSYEAAAALVPGSPIFGIYDFPMVSASAQEPVDPSLRSPEILAQQAWIQCLSRRQ